MVRVSNILMLCLFMSSQLSYAENPVLKEEAQKILKRTRLNSDKELKEWADKTKKEALTKLEELKKSDLAPELIASTQVALEVLKDENFKGQLLAALGKVNNKNWQEVLKDAAALMKQKNLKLEDLGQNPQIILDYISQISQKEAGFWAERAKKAEIPVTETSPDLSLPTGSFKDALMLIKALSSYVKIENIEATKDNLLIRYFVAP